MKKVRCAVVGCGVIGPVHAEALSRSERAQLVATVDIVPEGSHPGREVRQKAGMMITQRCSSEAT